MLTMSQMKAAMEEVFLRYPERKVQYDLMLKNLPKSTYDLPKAKLLIKLRANATR